jgi:hypothetical protein
VVSSNSYIMYTQIQHCYEPLDPLSYKLIKPKKPQAMLSRCSLTGPITKHSRPTRPPHLNPITTLPNPSQPLPNPYQPLTNPPNPSQPLPPITNPSQTLPNPSQTFPNPPTHSQPFPTLPKPSQTLPNPSQPVGKGWEGFGKGL